MATKTEGLIGLAGQNFSTFSQAELAAIYRHMLETGLHGICFSPYVQEQGPGSIISEEQIRKRLNIIQPYTKWIRTFSCTDGNEAIPRIAKELGLKTLVGAWLGSDRNKNDVEVKNLIAIAKAGDADLLAVGNEVMYRKDLSEDELLEYMRFVKASIPAIPMGYADAYYEFANRPRVTAACDVLFANCYPFWEGCDIEYSLLYIKDMYYRAFIAGSGKSVIITETGWPNKGPAFGSSNPSYVNAIKYFINANRWSVEENIEMFYFSSFDEAWKVNDEGDVGANWGIWDKYGQLKYV